jgi:hypothetical protein
VGVATLSLSTLTGCGQHALVKSDLPIVRVVVYRNGVAYFERAGHVDSDSVGFEMKQGEVGDFLATLAVMEQNGSSVRSAAFPLEVDDDDAKSAEKKPDPKHGLRTVKLALDGRSHDLQVGYIAASPVWRPSYRLVMQTNGQASLQGWGIVENLSGEDWTDVKLALVAGAPIAFDAQLGTPVIPERPIVTDQGEVVVAVPKSETSVEQDRDSDGIPDAKDASDEGGDKPAPSVATGAATPAPGAPPPPPPAEVPAAADSKGAEGGHGRGQMKRAAPKSVADPGHVQPSATRNVRSLAAIATQGGNHPYEIPTPITVPDKSATMVLLVEQRVQGESIFLYAPDDGIPDSAGHPFHVARFTNGTPATLERGPIAVFQQGAFLGQGMVDPTAPGATTTVPFALERAIGVTKHTKSDVQGSRVAKIESGSLWLEHDYVVKTFYDFENGGGEAAKLLVRHPRASATRLFQPPAGTEDNLGSGSALVPGAVAAHGKAEIVVDERSATAEYADWFSEEANTAVLAYLADPRSNKDVVPKLAAAWPTRTQIVAKYDQRQKLQTELSALAAEAQEKRADLKAIEKNKTAEALRKRLTDRLAAIAARQDTLTAQLVQVGQDLSELTITWREAIRAITLTEVPSPKP